MIELKHSVLGTPYIVKLGARDEINLNEEFMGECRVYSKDILVCTDKGECTEEELERKVQEIVAHEIFHAYVNEAGLDLDHREEELLATFFMKNWRKMNNSILEVLDETGFLDK